MHTHARDIPLSGQRLELEVKYGTFGDSSKSKRINDKCGLDNLDDSRNGKSIMVDCLYRIENGIGMQGDIDMRDVRVVGRELA